MSHDHNYFDRDDLPEWVDGLPTIERVELFLLVLVIETVTAWGLILAVGMGLDALAGMP